MAGKPATPNGENYDRLARIRGRLVCPNGVCNLVHLGQPIMEKNCYSFSLKSRDEVDKL